MKAQRGFWAQAGSVWIPSSISSISASRYGDILRDQVGRDLMLRLLRIPQEAVRRLHSFETSATNLPQDHRGADSPS